MRLVSWILLSGAFAACKASDKGAKVERPVPVLTATVMRKDMPVVVRAVGTVESVSTVEIMPQVTGLMMSQHFKEGDFVKKGALLFTVDTRPYRTNLAAAQAERAKNEALAAQAKGEAERYAKLAHEGLATDLELQRARASASSLTASLAANDAEIQRANLDVQFAKITSPIEGRTGSVLVHPGNLVRAGDSRPLVVIRTLAPSFVRFAVPEIHLPGIRTRLDSGAMSVFATPRGEGAKTATGSLTFLDNAVDTATGTIALKGLFPNTGLELWPGEFVDVALQLGLDKNAVVVPEAALQEGQDGAYAFVVSPQNRATLRQVEVKRRLDNQAVIGAGLQPGEQVVTDGQIRLRSGSLVEFKPLPPARDGGRSRASESRAGP